MKTVTDKYLEMNHNFIQLRDSIVEKVDNEKGLDAESMDCVFGALSVISVILDKYKKLNEIKTRVKEDDEFVEGDIYYPNSLDNKNEKCEDGVILSNPNAWK